MKLEYKNYASAITAERLIKLMVITLDGENEEYNTAVKIIVLDGPDVEITVRLDCWNFLGPKCFVSV